MIPMKMMILDNNSSEKELVTKTLRDADRFIRGKLISKPQNGIAMSWIKKEL